MEVRESASIAPEENAFEPISMNVDSLEFDDCKYTYSQSNYMSHII